MRLLASLRTAKFACRLAIAFILAALPLAPAAAETPRTSGAEAGTAPSAIEWGVTGTQPQTGSSAYTSGRAFSTPGGQAGAGASVPPGEGTTGALPAQNPQAVAPPPSKVLITIDKTMQMMKVFIDNVERYDWPVSTGKRGYDTPSGTYTARSMNEMWYSKQWDSAPMPHAIFFTKKGHAIHGTLEAKNLGRPASHGCVRIAPDNAALLFALVKEVGLANTEIVLSGEIPARGAKVASSGERKHEVKSRKKTALKRGAAGPKAKVASSAPHKEKLKPKKTFAEQGFDPREFDAPRGLSRRQWYRLYYSGPPQYPYAPYPGRRRFVTPGY